MSTVRMGTVILALALSASAHAATLDLQLTTRLPEPLPYLRPDMRLTVVNPTADTVLFPANALQVRLWLETEHGWRECRPLVASKSKPGAEIDWKELGPGASLRVTIPRSHCAEGRGTSFEWANHPGTHRVKAKITTQAHEVGVPAAAFDGSLESDVLEFRIRQPEGLDADAIEWAGGSPMSVELLDEFPDSEYAAFFIHGYSARIDTADPGRIGALIARGLYPAATSVPDRDGWRSLSREGVARWQMEWGRRILLKHPEFAFADEIRVSVALARMSLGERTEALRSLGSIAEKDDSQAAAWVRTFLDVESRE